MRILRPRLLPRAVQALRERGVEVRGDEASRRLVPDLGEATDADFAAEFLDLVIAVRVVADLDAAIAHICHYGSDHTEVIATGDAAHAERFVQSLRSAVVMVNASSRFSDGGELGGWAPKSASRRRDCMLTDQWGWRH